MTSAVYSHSRGDVARMTTERMLAAVLNQRLGSTLRVEIVSADRTQETGQVDLGELSDAIAARLSELERSPIDELPQESVWERDGLRLVWRARNRTVSEAGDPAVVVEPTV